MYADKIEKESLKIEGDFNLLLENVNNLYNNLEKIKNNLKNNLNNELQKLK